MKIICSVVFLCLFIPLNSKSQDNRISSAPLNRENLHSELALNSNNFSINYLDHPDLKPKYTHPLKKVGKIITFSGLPVMVLGAVMVSQADALYYNCVNGSCDGDPMGGFGILFLTAGVGSVITGGILWSIGGSKSYE